MCALASGSKGNCIYIECGRTRILVDAGLPKRDIRGRLARIGVAPEDISAILVSHEHTDHVKGVGIMSRGFGTPVYITGRTLSATMGKLGNGLTVREFGPGEPFQIDDIYVEPFPTPHDAAEPVGFSFSYGGVKIGFATDLGYATKLVIERLKGSDMLLVESNHDPVMLKDGPYPWLLKQRVAGKEGHLSNDDAGRLLSMLIHPGLRHVVLAHLSETNNLPELAYNATYGVLSKNAAGVRLSVASQNSVGEVLGV